MSSSSPRGIPASPAIIDGGRLPSPILLPVHAPETFIEEFERIYGRLGWRIEWTEQNRVSVRKPSSKDADAGL